jgi:predicted amidophosphoribosyltransferase
MAVIEWICDCCGAYLSQWEQHIMVGDEDRCGDCAVHLEHCHEYVPLVRRDSRDGLCVASVRVVERDTVNLEPFAMLVAGHPV